MTKNYNEVTNQVAVIKNSTRTLAFYVKARPAPMESFMELIEGKVKVSLYDFANGKGDNAIWVYYNLDLADVKYLYLRACFSNLPNGFYGDKIMGMAPERDGRFAGMCPVTRISIIRTPVDSQGKIMRSPWQIRIINGFAQAASGKVQGTFYEKPNTFIETGRAEMRLTDKEFLDCFDKIHRYINEYRRITAQNLIPSGLQILKEKEEQRGYSNNVAPQQSYGTYTSGMQYQQDMNQQMHIQPSVQTYPATQQHQSQQKSQQIKPQAETAYPGGPELHPTQVIITSDFQALENDVCLASCMTKGREYPVYFNRVPPQLKEAQAKNMSVVVNLFMDSDRRFWFHSIVQDKAA